MGDCDEVRKQMLTTFSLVGAALQWWESITTVEERDTLAIAEFWVRFDRKYFSFSGRDRNEEKIL